MSKKPFLIYLAFIWIFAGCFCEQRPHPRQDLKTWMSNNGKLKVLSTIEMIDDIVEEIGGEHIDALTLVTGELDPHTYQLVKGDDEKLRRADVIFFNGLGLEHGPSLRKQLAESPKAIGLGNAILEKSPQEIIRIDGQIDPHIWTDISIWSKIVPQIVETLSSYDPQHSEIYHKRGEILLKQMLETHKKIREELQKIPPDQRYLVTSHDAFNYFARAYLAEEEELQDGSWRIRFAAPEGLSPESQLSTSDIRLIIDHLKTYRIETLFPESNVSKDSIKKIVQAGQEIGLNVQIAETPLYGDAMGEGLHYLEMIEHNARTIKRYIHNNEQQQKS